MPNNQFDESQFLETAKRVMQTRSEITSKQAEIEALGARLDQDKQALGLFLGDLSGDVTPRLIPRRTYKSRPQMQRYTDDEILAAIRTNGKIKAINAKIAISSGILYQRLKRLKGAGLIARIDTGTYAVVEQPVIAAS